LHTQGEVEEGKELQELKRNNTKKQITKMVHLSSIIPKVTWTTFRAPQNFPVSTTVLWHEPVPVPNHPSCIQSFI